MNRLLSRTRPALAAGLCCLALALPAGAATTPIEVDRIVPAHMARQLHAAAGEPKELWLIEEADHYQALQERPEVARPRLLAFFGRCLADTRDAVPSA